MRGLLIVMFVGSLAACGTASGLKPVQRTNPFPARGAVEEISAQPPPESVFVESTAVRVPWWTLTGTLPTRLGSTPVTSSTAADRMLATVVAKTDGALATEQATCVAEQTGKFFLAYGGSPAELLRDFIVARCGATINVNRSWTHWEGEQEWGENTETSLRAMLGRLDVSSTTEVGVWFGSGHGRSVIMLAYGARQVALEPAPLSQSGEVMLTGTVVPDGRGDLIAGAATSGEFGVTRCTRVSASGASFTLKCDVSPTDSEVVLAVADYQRSLLVGTTIVSPRVYPNVLPDTWVAHAEPRVGAPVEAVDGVVQLPEVLPNATFDSEPTALRAELLNHINDHRQRAGLRPVTLAEAQSNVATTLGPHYWSAEDDTAQQETVLYGVLAGWHVDSPIVGGTFFTRTIAGDTKDMADMLMKSPGSRGLVMDEFVEQLSIAPTTEGHRVGVMVHGWEFLRDESFGMRVKKVLAPVRAARAARGLPDLRLTTAMNDFTKSLSDKLASSELQLHQAAGQLHQAMMERYAGQTVQLIYIEHNNLETVQWPESLVNTTPLDIAVVVAPYEVEGLPWHTYGIAIVYVVRGASTKVAALQ